MTLLPATLLASIKDTAERKQRAGVGAYAMPPEQTLALVRAVEQLRGALEEFRLSHEHAPGLPHTRALGDTYGWCDDCSTKVTWGPGIAEVALADVFGEEWK